MDGLVGLNKNGVIEDPDMIEGCYFRAVELLNDMEDCVRSAAVRTVCAWGLMLVACKSETKAYWSDEVFVKEIIKEIATLNPALLNALFNGERHEHGG